MTTNAPELNAVFYSMQETRTLVVCRTPLKDDDVLLQRDDYCIVDRIEQGRPRPLMEEYGGLLVRFEVRKSDASLADVLQIAKEIGLVPMSAIEDKVFLSTAEARTSILKRFGILKRLPNARELITRLGVLLKRPGGMSLKLSLRGCSYPEPQNDGTVGVTSALDEPMQGTFVTPDAALKGIIRPPLTWGGMTERDAYCQDAQFGATVENPKGEFHCVRRLTGQRGSMNLQAALFGLSDPVSFVEADNRRVAKMAPIDLVRRAYRDKVRAGVPAALLLDKMSPWRWARRYQWQSVSATVFGSDLVELGNVMLLPRTAHVLKKMYPGLKAGDTLILHRDPAKPDATSMHEFRFQGVCKWATSDGGDGIVLNASDGTWKSAGGDFDGDSAVVAVKTFAIKDDLPIGKNYRTTKFTPMTGVQGKPSFNGTLLAMSNTFAGSLGSTVLTSMKLAEVDALTDELAGDLSALVQAAVDAQKHAVDGKAANMDYQPIMDSLADLEPEGGFFMEIMNELTAQSGEQDKASKWTNLVLWAGLQGKTPIQQVLANRIMILDRLYRDSGFIRGNRLTMPDALRNAAKAALMELSDASQQIADMQDWSKEFRATTRELAGVVDEDAGAELRAKLQELRTELEEAYRDGDISGYAVLGYGPARTAAEVVDAKEIADLCLDLREAVVCIQGEVVGGSHDVTAITPCDSSKMEYDALIAGGIDTVSVQVIEQAEEYARCHVTVEGAKHFKISDEQFEDDASNAFFD